MDPFLVLTLAGAVVAGFVQGTAGFAFGLVAMAFWAWVLPPQTSAFLVVGGGLLGQLLTIRGIRLGFDARRIWPFVIGGLAGAPLGVALLPLVDQTLFKFGVGAVLMVWCPLMLLSARLPVIAAETRVADAGIGVVGGVMSGVAGLSGPATALWCALRAWDKQTQRAVIQSFNLAMHTVTMTLFFASGRVDGEALRLFGLVAPAMLIPSLAGAWFFNRLNTETYRKLLLWLLLMSGVALLAATLPKLIIGPM